MYGGGFEKILFLPSGKGANWETFCNCIPLAEVGPRPALQESRVDEVVRTEHKRGMRRVFLLAVISALGTGLALAELGKSLTDLKILKNLAVVRETLLYNRTFVLAVAEDKATAGRQAQYLFLLGECVQIRYFSGKSPWTEAKAQAVWREQFGDLPNKKKEEENLLIFLGANGEEMLVGKGKYAPALLIQSPRMTKIRNLWMEGQPAEFQTRRENDLDFSLWGFGPAPGDDGAK